MNGMAADWELGVSKRERLGIIEQQHPLLVWPQIEYYMGPGSRSSWSIGKHV
jgi:hypothetical protein